MWAPPQTYRISAESAGGSSDSKGLALSLFALLSDAEFEHLKAMCPPSFSWACTCSRGLTPLQMLVEAVATNLNTEPRCVEPAAFVDIGRWLMARGADPIARAGNVSDGVPKNLCWGEGERQVTMPVAKQTAISSLIALRTSMQDKDDAVAQNDEEDEDESDWSAEVACLSELLGALSDKSRALDADKLSVDVGVVELWAGLLADDASQDVVLETAGGSVGAHRLVLSSASKVLRAMLSSDMVEGRAHRIAAADTPRAAMTLFVELLYTGTSCADPDCGSAAGAFELAHRWDVSYLLPMLERVLVSLLDADNFETVGELAVLKGSADFERAVATWGAASAAVQTALAGGAYSVGLRKVLGIKEGAQGASRARKRKAY